MTREISVIVTAGGLAVAALAGLPPAAAIASEPASDQPCRVIERQAEQGSGSHNSSSVSVGDGTSSATTSVGGSGASSSSSSVSVGSGGAGSTVVTGSSPGGTTVMTDSSGHCVIETTRPADEHKE